MAERTITYTDPATPHIQHFTSQFFTQHFNFYMVTGPLNPIFTQNGAVRWVIIDTVTVMYTDADSAGGVTYTVSLDFGPVDFGIMIGNLTNSAREHTTHVINGPWALHPSKIISYPVNVSNITGYAATDDIFIAFNGHMLVNLTTSIADPISALAPMPVSLERLKWPLPRFK